MCEYFETHTGAQVFERIVNGNAYLWPGRECAIVGQLVKHPNGIQSFNYWLQGGKLDELKTLWPGVEAWAKKRVPSSVQPKLPITGYGREGWAEVMDGDWQTGPRTRIKWL